MPAIPITTVGRGKPPLHTRFQKGQSGNPGGKPGPAKLARQRFQRALHAALDAETGDLKDARPRVNLEVMVRRLMLDAAGGDRGAMKLILSELDSEIAREEPSPRTAPSAAGGQAMAGGSMTEAAEEESGEEGATEPPPLPDYALWLKANQGE